MGLFAFPSNGRLFFIAFDVPKYWEFCLINAEGFSRIMCRDLDEFGASSDFSSLCFADNLPSIIIHLLDFQQFAIKVSRVNASVENGVNLKKTV